MRTHPAQQRTDFTLSINLPESNTMSSTPVIPDILSPSVYTNQLQSAGDQHENMVANLFKDMGTDSENLMHAAAGIAGEAGELLDAGNCAGVSPQGKLVISEPSPLS